MERVCGVERVRAIQRFDCVSASCPTVRLSSKDERCEQAAPARRLVYTVGVGDLPRGEAERRLDLPNSPDPGHEAEPLEIRERGDDALLAAHRQMGDAFEARKDAAVF